ncbi:MAG: FecR family protein [Ghiorsea sp.]|nr:FecR family protein [Ghiorsea sp.]
MFKAFIFFTLTMMSVSLLPAQQSFAASGVGRVAYSYGPAWIEHGAQLDKLEKEQVVFRNDSIITGSRGRVKVMMRDGSKIYIGAKSRISLRQYTMKKDKLFSATINMLWGKARFFINKLTTKNASFKVNTPTAVLGVRGTEFIVSVPPTPDLLAKALQHISFRDVPALPTRTALIEGAIQVSTGLGKPVLLRPGNTADIGANKKIHTFKTSSDDIDKHEQDVSTSSTPQGKKGETTKESTKPNTQKDNGEISLTPPLRSKIGKAKKQFNSNEKSHSKAKETLEKLNINDTTNAIQNLKTTTDITIKPSFVKP